jgi:hypothetical protein
MATRKKGVELSGGVWFLIFALTAGSLVNQWASGHPLRWALAIMGTLVVVWVLFRLVCWLLRKGLKRRRGIMGGVRSRKRLKFLGVGRLNLSGGVIPLPTSVGVDIGPYSTNSRTRQHRVNLPNAWWWQRKWGGAQNQQEPPRPGDPVRAPIPTWVKTNYFLVDHNGETLLDPLTAEPFPLDVLPDDFRKRYCNGYEVMRHPKPLSPKSKSGRRSGYVFILEGRAEFGSWQDAWEACNGLSSQQRMVDNMERNGEAM